MTKLPTILSAFLATCAIAGSAIAQSGALITNRDVVGQWTLRITPAEQRGFSVSVQAADGGQPDLRLAITAATGGSLRCVVHERPAECRIENGDLVVVSTSGRGRLTFRLTDRAGGGFNGTADLRVRLLPVGGHIGTVSMRRQ